MCSERGGKASPGDLHEPSRAREPLRPGSVGLLMARLEDLATGTRLTGLAAPNRLRCRIDLRSSQLAMRDIEHDSGRRQHSAALRAQPFRDNLGGDIGRQEAAKGEERHVDDSYAKSKRC